MADKKKGKQRKIEEEKPTKEEYAVAKYLRFNLPVREGKLVGMEVKCFIGSAAVDKLLESKWSKAKNEKDFLFPNRNACVSYMVRLLEKGLFHRAEREKRKKERPIKKKRKEGEKEETNQGDEELRERKGKKEKRSRREKEKEKEIEQDDKGEKKVDKVEKKEEKKKKEKRLKLIMPEDQHFTDGDEVYVWIYDPVNAKNFLIGLLMVLGAIALCMFPLWPEEVRVGVYYLSLAAAGFVGFILFLVVVRLILFCCIWALTFGKHHFWFLPNLTEDVGFFDSFKPLYKHDVVTRESKAEDGKKKAKKIDKSGQSKEKSSDKEDSDEFELVKKEDLVDNGENNVNEDNNQTEDPDNENDNQEQEDDDNQEQYDDDDNQDRDDDDIDEDDENIVDENSEEHDDESSSEVTLKSKKESKKKK